MEKNGCGPKIEPVEPASEQLLPHLLCIHVILKTQLRYTLKKNLSLAAFAGTFGQMIAMDFQQKTLGFNMLQL